MAEVLLMAGKSALVTGGTGGIGMSGRDQARAAAAVAGIHASKRFV